jgi:TRAP-type C4-dicarboxylate transport system permease small subunit
LILVPLTSVLYVIALVSFAVAGFYGFRLTTMARKMKVMIMVTQDGPQSIVGGIVLLATSQVVNTVMSLTGVVASDVFTVSSVVMLVGSALMFAFGFQKMYSVYFNEKTRMNVNSILDELEHDRSADKDPEKWLGEMR